MTWWSLTCVPFDTSFGYPKTQIINEDTYIMLQIFWGFWRGLYSACMFFTSQVQNICVWIFFIITAFSRCCYFWWCFRLYPIVSMFFPSCSVILFPLQTTHHNTVCGERPTCSIVIIVWCVIYTNMFPRIFFYILLLVYLSPLLCGLGSIFSTLVYHITLVEFSACETLRCTHHVNI